MKAILKSIVSIFSAEGKLSSKRIFGGLGMVVCLWAFIYCTIKVIQAPTMSTEILVASTTLLGVDSFATIFNKSSNQNKEDEPTDV